MLEGLRIPQGLESVLNYPDPYLVPHLYTHTFGEGLRSTCLLTGGLCAQKSTSLIRPVLVGALLARYPRFSEHGLATFLHMGGTGRVVVRWRIVQNCAAQHLVRTQSIFAAAGPARSTSRRTRR